MHRIAIPGLMLVLAGHPACAQTRPATASPTATQKADDEAAKNSRHARAALDAMVKALGGDAWLNIKNSYRQGHIAGFYQGNPDPGTMQVHEYHQWPDHDRINVTKHQDVVEFFIGNEGWELTYHGKRPLPKDQVDDFLRRRDHSIETAVKVWMKEPQTILVYEGQHLAARHLADQVTLISPQNQAITILMDADTHLPLRRSFQWRDPVYHDKNTDVEEYDDYHVVGGFPTPFTVTRLKNDEMVSQFYLEKAAYNQTLQPGLWDVDAVARKLKH